MWTRKFLTVITQRKIDEEDNRNMDLASALTRSKQLMDVTTSPTFTNYTNEMKQGGYIPDIDSIPEGIPMAVSQSPRPYREQAFDVSQINPNSKLPRAIVESIKNNPLIPEHPDDIKMRNFTQSVKEQMEAKGINIKPSFSNIQKQQTAQPVQQVVSGIDYSLIKTIVEEAVRKSTASIKKQLLTESNQSSSLHTANMMQLGEKLKVVDNDGNLYEAEFKFIKNIKKKK